MSVLGPLWTLFSSYRPNAAADRKAQKNSSELRFGAFKATYAPPGLGIRRPRNDGEAQRITLIPPLPFLELTQASEGGKADGRLYNHIRTVAFWLDAAPVLADLGLPFRAGLDDIISLVPIYGDILSGILQLYQVWLCFVFGVPRNLAGYMLLNVVIDVIVGIVPIIGDFLDNLFKSNLRNLALLEEYLLSNPSAERYHILLMPDGNEFMPKAKSGRSWFGAKEVNEEREEEHTEGRVKRTRRMGRDEASFFGTGPVPADGVGTGTSSATETEAPRGRKSQKVT